MATVYAACVESNRTRPKYRLFHGPVTEEDGFPAAIDRVPGHTLFTRRIRAHGAYLGQVTGHLMFKPNAWTHAGVDNQMRAKIDHVRKRFQIICVAFAVGFKLGRGFVLFFGQAIGFATPALAQGSIMIADNRRKALVVYKEIEHFAILFTFDDQVPDCDDAIVTAQLEKLEQVSEFVKAPMNITDNDCAAHLCSLNQTNGVPHPCSSQTGSESRHLPGRGAIRLRKP